MTVSASPPVSPAATSAGRNPAALPKGRTVRVPSPFGSGCATGAGASGSTAAGVSGSSITPASLASSPTCAAAGASPSGSPEVPKTPGRKIAEAIPLTTSKAKMASAAVRRTRLARSSSRRRGILTDGRGRCVPPSSERPDMAPSVTGAPGRRNRSAPLS